MSLFAFLFFSLSLFLCSTLNCPITEICFIKKLLLPIKKGILYFKGIIIFIGEERNLKPENRIKLLSSYIFGTVKRKQEDFLPIMTQRGESFIARHLECCWSAAQIEHANGITAQQMIPKSSQTHHLPRLVRVPRAVRRPKIFPRLGTAIMSPRPP